MTTFLADHFQAVQQQISAPQVGWACSIDGERVGSHNENLRFRIASMTKSFVAASVLLLRDRGQVQLDRPITDYVPVAASLKAPTADSATITVRHLLTMSSGMATDDPWADRLLDLDDAATDAVIETGAWFAGTPGAPFVYSNLGYVVLGRLISLVAGESFDVFIEHEFLQPLGLASSSFHKPSDNVAVPHRVRDGVAIDEGVPPLPHGAWDAMAGLWTTPADVLRWAEFFLDAFPPRDDADNGPLSRSTRREMQQLATRWPTNAIDPSKRVPFGGYAMGLLDTHDSIAGRRIDHTGGLPGYGSNMAWYPERGLAIVSMANVTYAPMSKANLDAVALLHEHDMLPPTVTEPTDALQPFADRLIDLLNDWSDGRQSDEKADALFTFNVALDESYERRRAEASTYGQLQVKGLRVTNRAVATIDTVREDGTEQPVWFTLSSRNPPGIQSYGFGSGS
jgi:CubicO group peptidase (beta-lactamase class C family)